jgi:hypothetical protein
MAGRARLSGAGFWVHLLRIYIRSGSILISPSFYPIIALPYRITVVCALAALGTIIVSAPLPVSLVLELADFAAVDPEAPGQEMKPVWWAGLIFPGTSLVLCAA